MDLHSYAKRRSAKKWTIEHKRKLVDARISYDNMFANHPAMSLVPWRKFINLAKLDGYNVLFVRKQWFSLVAKYKQQKQNRLGNLPSKSMDSELLQRMSEEWEFFAPIHTFMTHKTTDLHSYALKEPNQAEAASRRAYKTLPPALPSALPATTETLSTPKIEPTTDEQMNECSSDTNEAAMGIRNDHDFYSKKTNFYHYQQQHNGDETTHPHRHHLHHHLHHHHDETTTAACDMVWPMISSYFADGSEDADTKESMAKLLLEPKFENFLHDDDYESAVELQLPAYVREEVAETTTRTNDEERQQKQQQQQKQQNKQQQQQQPQVPSMSLQEQQQQQQQQQIQKPKFTTATTGIGTRSSRRTKRNFKCCGGVGSTTTEQQTQSPQRPPPTARAPPALLGCGMQSERDAYYRHKRRFNHRQERRFDALLAVFGQIVKSEYPSIDVQQLHAMAGAASASSEEEA